MDNIVQSVQADVYSTVQSVQAGLCGAVQSVQASVYTKVQSVQAGVKAGVVSGLLPAESVRDGIQASPASTLSNKVQ